jgi:hypothetical protein
MLQNVAAEIITCYERARDGRNVVKMIRPSAPAVPRP